jgi:beta-lysine 5,6-aminomutase beta subunit
MKDLPAGGNAAQNHPPAGEGLAPPPTPTGGEPGTKIRPFGDHVEDGVVQLSFSLPVAQSPVAKQAARAFAEKLGLRHVEIVHEIGLCSGASYYVVYARSDQTVDLALIEKREHDYELLSKEEIEALVHERGRPIRVIGASTGSDTHSVGIDAILNHKGYNGHPGLEAYQGFIAQNLGSQVANERLVARALDMHADAILVSQTVTQQDLHVANLTALVDMLEAEGLRDRFLLICGGARISPELAKELGYDAGFSKGSYAEHVASFLVSEVLSAGRAGRMPRVAEAVNAQGPAPRAVGGL